MNLSELDIDAIAIGLNVISAIGTSGEVTQIDKESNNKFKPIFDRVRYDTVFIAWDNGKKSVVYHPMEAVNIKVKE